MKLQLLVFAFTCLLGAPTLAQDTEPAKKQTDTEIAKILIRQSVDAYDGNCPCPYHTMRNGRRCGGNSAYSRPGGEDPLCFRRDITDEMIVEYRAAHAD